MPRINGHVQVSKFLLLWSALAVTWCFLVPACVPCPPQPLPWVSGCARWGANMPQACPQLMLLLALKAGEFRWWLLTWGNAECQHVLCSPVQTGWKQCQSFFCLFFFCNVYFSSEWGTSFHSNIGKVDCEYLVTAVPYISFVSFYLIFVHFFLEVSSVQLKPQQHWIIHTLQ